MQEVVIVGAARTPFGRYLGSLADQRCQDLAAGSMKEAIRRAPPMAGISLLAVHPPSGMICG